MKRTFDQLFNEIVGEAIVNAGQPNPNQQQNQQQNQNNQQQNQNNQQQPNEHDEVIKKFMDSLNNKDFAAKVVGNQDLQKALALLQQAGQQQKQQYSNNNAANKQA